MESKNNRKIGLIFLGVVISALVFFTVYALITQSNKSSEASSTEVQLKDYQPEEIIEGETETLLINGSGFKEDCVFSLGSDELTSTFINSESVEIELPTRLPSQTLKVECNGTSDLMQITITPKLEQLPE